MVNDETLVSIRALVHYIIENKKDVFFDDAMKILRWLDEAQAAYGTCPRCKKESMQIHGEGILSDGRHYPIEECLYCGFIPTDFTEYSGTPPVTIKENHGA